MKCFNCNFFQYHEAGDAYAVANGLADAYPTTCCMLGHWENGPANIEEIPEAQDSTAWNTCEDFKQKLADGIRR